MKKPHDFSTMLDTAPRFLFFTGKGGVGKTSLACATAVALADRGSKVLLVSTDPASNLDEVLRTKIAGSATQIAGAANMWAINIDPEAAAQAYRDRMVSPYRGKLPDAVIKNMEEQFSGACTAEIASFDEFAKLLGEPDATATYDHVIFDTAPTGHTLRLISLPMAWTDFLESNTTGTSCLGPLAGLQRQREVYENSLKSLKDGAKTLLVIVSRAQKAALVEAERASSELASIGLRNQLVILNGLFRATSSADRAASALEKRNNAAIEAKKDFLAKFPAIKLPLRSRNLIGLDVLRSLTADDDFSHSAKSAPRRTRLKPLSVLVDELASAGSGVIMTMGKGGVGKTTIAAAIATELARRGLPVHLSTTDPAAHVAAAAGDAAFKISRIDPKLETQNYTREVLEKNGADVSPEARALLEEDLRSPCTEEIAVFRAFAKIVAEGRNSFVVLDTAPTGHTLLLLDATEAYHREIARNSSGLPDDVIHLLPRLRDPRFTKVLIVTLPEPTPVHEAAALQNDLRRANIEPFAWVINQSFSHIDTADPLLIARAHAEAPYIDEVVNSLAKTTVSVDWAAEEPVGSANLLKLLNQEKK